MVRALAGPAPGRLPAWREVVPGLVMGVSGDSMALEMISALPYTTGAYIPATRKNTAQVNTIQFRATLFTVT
jgi:hypothetical protein